ncbi:uncharacterized protein B0T15DRAFT_489312 [Chaetomium strumarium]|uniref:SnoaL-like domain-containing protein n=1 Tax=Chaetomium strumarium TaxID=1170767 RepID=A0AAJ0H2I2_9PEZI|nr:hypothetical protein B0T15DRAFT_489312 [Chaetomium strumarium]
MASYDIAQYLLDRANIQDTVTKNSLYYDTRNISGLANEVYAASILIDYTSILGGEPTTLSRTEWLEQAQGILQTFESSQHLISGIIIDLPQPAPASSSGGTTTTTTTTMATRPEKASLMAHVGGNMILKGQPSSNVIQNGGILEAELQRDPELEKQGVNPWRITKYKVIKKWGNGPGDKVLASELQA